jgi:hypothetical protein
VSGIWISQRKVIKCPSNHSRLKVLRWKNQRSILSDGFERPQIQIQRMFWKEVVICSFFFFFFKRRYEMPQKHTWHSCVAHPVYPELYKCNSWESTFVEFCVDGINLYVENNFIDSLGPGRVLTSWPPDSCTWKFCWLKIRQVAFDLDSAINFFCVIIEWCQPKWGKRWRWSKLSALSSQLATQWEILAFLK